MTDEGFPVHETDISRRVWLAALGALGATMGLPALAARAQTNAPPGPALGTQVGWVDTIGTVQQPGDLRGITSVFANTVIALGFWTRGDGGGGVFYWDNDTTTPDDGGLVIVPDPGGGSWKRVVGAGLNVKWFGARADGTTDDQPAMQAAIDLAGTPAYPSGQSVVLPRGSYKIARPLIFDRQVMVMGEGYINTTLQVDAGQIGLWVKYPGGVNTSIRDLGVRAAGQAGTPPGMLIEGKCIAANMFITGFGGNGISIIADTQATNANGTALTNIQCASNGGYGLYVSGRDANGCLFQNVQCTDNPLGEFYEASGLGNTYVQCLAESGAGGHIGYQAPNLSATNLFLGCYQENALAASIISQPSVVIGGTLAESLTNTSDCTVLLATGQPHGIGSRHIFTRDPTHDNPQETGDPLICYMDQQDGKSFFTMNAYGSEDIFSGFAWTNYLGVAVSTVPPGWYAWTKGASANVTPTILFAGNSAQDPQGSGRTIGYGYTWIPGPLYFGVSRPGAGQVPLQWSVGRDPSGTPGAQGDVVWNQTPSAGGTIGWVCVTTGHPGTWKAFGAIAM